MGSVLEGEGSVAGESMQSFQTGGAVQPEVNTVFSGESAGLYNPNLTAASPV